MPKLFEYIDLNDLSKFKTEYDKKVEADITTAKNEIEQSSNGAYASYMTVEQNAETGVVTFKLYSSDNTLLDTKTLDLDTEHIIKSVSLDYANKKLVFTMADDSTIETDISDLIDGLKSEIQDVADDLADEVSRAETAEQTLDDNKLEKLVVSELPSQNIKTNTIYLLARNNEGVVTYRFESYNEEGTVKYADGMAEKTGVVDGNYTQIVVTKNEPINQEAPDYVGQTFMILTNAGVDDDSLNELYTNDKVATGIKIKIYTATVDGYYEYMFINNKWECIGGNGVDVSGKEDKSNKATTFTNKTDDKHYPTTKLVKDTIDNLTNDINDGDINLIDDNDLDTIFPDLESESE